MHRFSLYRYILSSSQNPTCGHDALKQPHRLMYLALLISGMLLTTQAAVSQTPPTYNDIAPLLTQKCVMCHSGQTAALGLQLDSYDGITKGSTRGTVVKAGDPATSELIRRIKGVSQPRMPLTGPPFLSEREIALFERWVAGGLAKGTLVQAAPTSQTPPPRPAPGQPVSYQHVAPIFATRCVKCHTDNGLMGPAPEGYRLNGYAATLSPADRVRVVPGQPAASELLRRIKGQARPRMPFDGPPFLSQEEINLIETWIAQGARDTEGHVATIPAGAKVRLHGTLEPGGRLDGLDLVTGAHTRIDKSPSAGDYVEVRGVVAANGTIEVQRLRRR